MIWLEVKEFAARENSLLSFLDLQGLPKALGRKDESREGYTIKNETRSKDQKPTYEDLAFEGVPKIVGNQSKRLCDGSEAQSNLSGVADLIEREVNK